MAALTFAWHWNWLSSDNVLPIGDAGGHLLNVARHAGWLRGGPLPAEAFPPGYYVVAAQAVRTFGADIDVVVGTTAAFAALLALALCWLGARSAGPVAGVLAALFALAAPMVAATTRQVLLDIPMTAIIVCIWACAWESKGFRRPLPTLLVGACLAAGALIKYTLFPWVLPTLVLTGLWMVVRAPLSLLSLCLAIPPALAAARAIHERALAPVASRLSIEILDHVVRTGVLWGSVAVAVGVGCLLARRRWPGLQGVGDGAWLAAAATLAITLVSPWFLHAMPLVWVKVRHEAITEVLTSDLDTVRVFVGGMIFRSWPKGWLLAQAALLLEAAWLLRVAFRKQEDLRFGPALSIVFSCALGTWHTANNLPVDVRYYLPLLVGTSAVLAVGLTRTRIGAWGLAPLAFVLLAWQLWADRFGTPERLEPAGFNGARVQALDTWGPFAPPAARVSELAAAIHTLIDTIASEKLDCDSVVMLVPPFKEGRARGIEGRSIAALAHLRGVRECALATVEFGNFAPQRTWLAVVAINGWSESGTVEWRRDVNGRLAAWVRMLPAP